MRAILTQTTTDTMACSETFLIQMSLSIHPTPRIMMASTIVVGPPTSVINQVNVL